MKIAIFLTVYFIQAAVCAVPRDTVISPKDEFRLYFKRQLIDIFGNDVNEVCTHVLSSEQTRYGNEKYAEFIRCGNSTIDKFVDNLDFNINISDVSNLNTIRKYIGPVCTVLDDIFKCIAGVEPVIDMCISDEERQFKVRLFTIVPLMQQTVCLKNGELLADLLENKDGPRCFESVYEWLSDIALDETFNDDIEEFFGSEAMCRQFNVLRLETYKKIGECSSSMLDVVSEMLGYFCEGTQCNRFIRDLECF